MDEETRLMAQFQALQNKPEIAEVVKELFKKDGINMITDLSKDEVRLLTRIHGLAMLKDLPQWSRMCEMYAQLVLSSDRKSRKEILDAIRGYQPPMGMFGKMRDRLQGNR